jgi:hypothetical protein
MQIRSSTRATFRFEPLRDNSRTVGGSEVIQLGIVRISPGESRLAGSDSFVDKSAFVGTNVETNRLFSSLWSAVDDSI